MKAQQKKITRVQRLAKRPCLDCGDVWREITYRGQRKIATVCYVNGHPQDRKHSTMAQQIPMQWAAEGIL